MTKITVPSNYPKISNEMCLDFTTPVSPASNVSLSPIMKVEDNFIHIPYELTEFDICGEYFKNVVVDEYEKKIRQISKSNVKK